MAPSTHSPKQPLSKASSMHETKPNGVRSVTIWPRVAVTCSNRRARRRRQVRRLRLIPGGVCGFTFVPITPGHQDPGQERNFHDPPAPGQKQTQPTPLLPAVPSPRMRGLLRPRAALPSATALCFLGLCDSRCLWVLGAPWGQGQTQVLWGPLRTKHKHKISSTGGRVEGLRAFVHVL